MKIYRCVDCSKKLHPTVGERFKSNPNRRCMKCHLNPKVVPRIRKSGFVVPVGTKGKDFNNYIRIKTDDGWMLEHRFLMEKKIGRKLKNKELVHHKNHNPSDNRIANLELCESFRQHLETHHKKDLKNPPIHHFGRRKWGKKEYDIYYGKVRS